MCVSYPCPDLPSSGRHLCAQTKELFVQNGSISQTISCCLQKLIFTLKMNWQDGTIHIKLIMLEIIFCGSAWEECLFSVKKKKQPKHIRIWGSSTNFQWVLTCSLNFFLYIIVSAAGTELSHRWEHSRCCLLSCCVAQNNL